MFGLSHGETVLVIAPHPDDETLGCGGTIARLTTEGITVAVLAVACATIAPALEPATAATTSDPAVRRGEFNEACDVLGVGPRRLAWTDARAADPGADLPTLVALIESDSLVGLTALGPAAVLTPTDGSHHQDHQAVHRATRAACRPGAAGRRRTVRILLGFEGPDDRAWRPACTAGPVLVDTSEHWTTKEKALSCYPSQLRGDPHPRSLERIHAADVAAGAAIGSAAAEVFTPYRMAF